MREDLNSLSDQELQNIIDQEDGSIGRDLAIGGKNAAVGALTAIPDTLSLIGNTLHYGVDKGLGYLLDNQQLKDAAGNQPVPYISDYLNQGIDKLTNSYLQPRNLEERVVAAASNMVGGGKSFAKAGATEASQLAQKFLAPQNALDYAAYGTAGAGSEIGKEITDNSTIGGITGGVVGSTLPYLLSGGKNLAILAANKGMSFSPSNYAIKKQLGNLTPEEVQPSLEAAARLGDQLTPAEASGSPFIAAKQGRLGTSEEGAQELYQIGKDRALNRQGTINDLLNQISPSNKNAAEDVRQLSQSRQQAIENTHLGAEHRLVDSFLNKLSPTSRDVSTDVRNAANIIIKQQQQQLSDKAAPFYQAAYPKKIAPNKLKSLMQSDGNIENAVKGVLKDPRYKAELKGYAPNSIKVLDLAKRRMDAQIENATGTAMVPGDRDAVRVLTNSKKTLVDAMDRFSPDYAQGRGIYSEGSPAIESIRNSPIGKIASLDDSQLKNISKIIFDPAQTNPVVLNDIKTRISQQDPNLWKALTRNHIESKLDIAPGESIGAAFNNKLLNNDRNTAQLQLAIKGNPELEQQLNGMKNTFSHSADNLKAIRSTHTAKFANMNDDQLKSITADIFNPAQTDLNRFKSIKQEIQSQSPEVWNRLVRNNLENKLNATPGVVGASKFYKTVLAKNRDFNQLITSVKEVPGAVQKLRDMRQVYKNLIEPVTSKTAANLAKSSLDVPRSSLEFAKNFLSEMTGGFYDKAAIKLIFDPKWNEKLLKPAQTLSAKTRNYSAALNAITHGATQSLNAEHINNLESMSDDELHKIIQEDEQSKAVTPLQQSIPQAQQPVAPVTKAPQKSLVDKIAYVESGNNTNAKSANSTASGLFQFTNSTWKEAVDKYGAETGVTYKDKNNPRAQKAIAERTLRDNGAALKEYLGRAPQDTEVYLTHFLGLKGAKDLLAANPSQFAAQILPEAAKANRSVFFNNGHPLTVAQLYANLNKKIARANV